MIASEISLDLGSLSSLEWINVSHNQLVGSIPQGTQFQRKYCSSYEENHRLDKSSLKNVCNIHAPTPPPRADPHTRLWGQLTPH